MAVQIGAQLGEYRLVRELGTGTFGTVYQAEHVHLRTQVAIKVLHGQITDDERARLRAEARNQAALGHAFIVPVLGYSEQPVPYLVMKFAPNGTLKDRYRLGQRYPLAAILPHVRQIAEGLQHAHNMNLMHLDLKPANILLGEQQEALISDFGIAVILQEFKTHQTMSDFAGTPAYAAPEQIQNKPSKASDQYALATMVYQWLAGTLPFRGDPWSIGVQKLAQNPPALRPLVPNLPPKVEKVVLRALAKEPGKRFPSVSDFARALEEAALSAAPPLAAVPPLVVPPLVVPPAGRRAPAPDAPTENIHTAATKISQPQLSATTPVVQPPQQTRPAEQHPSLEPLPTLPLAGWEAGGTGTPPGPHFPRSVAGRFRRLPKRRKILVLAATLLLVLGAGAAYLLSLRVPLKDTYTLTTTQSDTNIARQQVNSHLASIEIDHQTQTTPATGGPAPAAQARGTLHFYNDTSQPVFLPQGSVLDQRHLCTAPIQMVLDADVTIPASPDGQYGEGVVVPAHVLQYGTIGNVSAFPDEGCFHSDEGSPTADGTSFIGWVVQNDNPFTGGRDAVLQQSDIDGVAQSIMAAHPAPNPTDALQIINTPHSRLLETPAPSCGTRVTADHVVGDKIGAAQVFFTYVCSGYVYDEAGAEQVATNLLTAQAAQNLHGFFKPDGEITATITSITLTDPQQATFRLMVVAQGTWTFQL